MARGTKSGNNNDWRQAKIAPIVLIYGSEEYFVAQILQSLRQQFRENFPESELQTLSAKDYSRGDLAVVASPSLFGSSKIIEISQLASMSEDFLKDILSYADAPDNENMLLLHHSGGNRGKKFLDLMRASRKYSFLEAKPLKTDQEKHNFVLHEIQGWGKTIDSAAVRLLVAVAGSDTSELASACQQLINDGPDHINEQLVETYYGGRVEATAFKVSDAAVAGDSRQALKLLRNALDTGVEPIPLVGALALKMRNIAKVHGSGGYANALASELKMAPWQVEQAQRDSRRYSSGDLSKILQVLADVDSQLKGEAVDPLYSLEKAVLTIARAR